MRIIISFHLRSIFLFFFFLPGGLSLISVVEVQRVYFLRARTGYLFPGATGSCTGRSCGTTVKHRRGTQDYERRSSEQRSIHRCRRYGRIRNPAGSLWNTVFNPRCIDISLYVHEMYQFLSLFSSDGEAWILRLDVWIRFWNGYCATLHAFPGRILERNNTRREGGRVSFERLSLIEAFFLRSVSMWIGRIPCSKKKGFFCQRFNSNSFKLNLKIVKYRS